MDFEGHNDAEGAMPGLPIMTFADGNMHEGGMHQEFAYMNPEDVMPDDGQLEGHRDHGGRDHKGGKPRFRGPRGPRPIKEQEYSIRHLIPCKMVGAVIGTCGNKIKKITEATNTSIDIHRKEDRREVDKLVTIRGNPEDCSQANMQIHKLMRDETDETLRSNEIEMRLVIHDCHAGRIIGRKGTNLKTIMEETGATSIKVSGNTGERMGHSSMLNVGDRIVSIKCLIKDGSDGQEPVTEEEALDSCRQAEKRISTKVHECLKKDMDDLVRSKQMQNPFYTQSVPWNQPHYGGPMPPVVGDIHSGGNLMSPCSHYPQTGHYAQAYQQMQAQDDNTKEIVVRLAIPQKYAGAVIGTKGSFCSYMKAISKASKVHVSADDKSGERYVEIHGSPLAQYFAQHCVYCKLAEQGYSNSDGELKLRVEIGVPVKGASRGNKETNIIGRIIGKGGQNVKGLEHETRTYVKVATTEDKDGEPEKAVVQIVGSFASSQHAQFRINEIVRLCQQENVGHGGVGGGVAGIPPGSHPGPGKRPPPHVS